MAEEVKTPEPELPRIRIVYKGIEMGYLDGKPRHIYIEKGGNKETFVFDNLLGRYKLVGTIITVSKTATGVRSPYVFDGIDDTNPELGAWRTRNWANEDLLVAKKAAERNRKGLEKELKTIRERYKTLHSSQRHIFISSLVYEITK